MKLAILLIVLGVVLLVDGVMRMFIGIDSENWLFAIAGLLTGIGLGTFLLWRRLRRLRRVRSR